MLFPVNMSKDRILVLQHLFYSQGLVSYDFWLNSAIKNAQNECRFYSRHVTKKPFSSIMRYIVLWHHYDVIASMQTLNMVPLEAPYPDIDTDTFIFFLWSLCKIIWMNVHYFPNAPRIFIPMCLSVERYRSIQDLPSWTKLWCV